MGQRTQLVVEIFEKNRFKNGYKRSLASYHNQWGFAKMQIFDVMRLITTYINYEGFNFPDYLHKGFRLPESESFNGIATPENVMTWINNYCDNNNGGALLKLLIKDYQVEAGKLYLFNDPESDGSGKVNRHVSLDEYVNFNPEYFNDDFINYFNSFLKFYNIKLM